MIGMCACANTHDRGFPTKNTMKVVAIKNVFSKATGYDQSENL